MKALVAMRVRGWRVLFVTALLLLPLLVGWLSTRTALFTLGDVQVLGSDDEELQARVRERVTPFFGRSLFALPLREVERDLAQLPWVRSVSLRRSYPSRLVVRVDTRRPAAVAFRQGALWALDEEGRYVETLKRARGLPLFIGAPDNDELRRELCAWLLRAQARGFALNEAPDEVLWDEERGLSLHFVGANLEVDLGHRNFDAALLRAQRAHGLLLERGVSVSFLDAAYSKRVVARLRNPASSLNLSK